MTTINCSRLTADEINNPLDAGDSGSLMDISDRLISVRDAIDKYYDTCNTLKGGESWPNIQEVMAHTIHVDVALRDFLVALGRS